MAVTIQQIADLAGVSRGTVDRALNNRGRIRPEVAEKIKEIAKELGYQPNMAAKALSTANHALQIGVIIQYAETPFMKAVLEGTESAKEEVERFGGQVFVERIHGGDVKKLLRIMKDFREAGVKGIRWDFSYYDQLRSGRYKKALLYRTGFLRQRQGCGRTHGRNYPRGRTGYDPVRLPGKCGDYGAYEGIRGRTGTSLSRDKGAGAKICL